MKLLPPTSLPGQAPLEAGPATFAYQTIAWQGDGFGFGFDATTGEFFTASAIALLVMRCLSQGQGPARILECICATYDVPRRTAERDLESFLAELSHLGLTGPA